MLNTVGERILAVDLCTRLPDVDCYRNLPHRFEDYGRLAILNSGTFWSGDIRSSHPPNTREGFYWATRGDTLFLSPRGALLGWQAALSCGILPWFFRQQTWDKRYRVFRIISSAFDSPSHEKV